MLRRTLAAALLILAISLWPNPASAAPAAFGDVTLWLQHGQVYPMGCFDLRVEARSNGLLVASAATYPTVPVCITSYGMAQFVRLPFQNVPGAMVNPGDIVEVTVLARMAVTRIQPQGSLRLWYNGWNGGNADSYIRGDLGLGFQTYHFEAGNQLSLVPPTGPGLNNVQYSITKPSYYSLGTWGRVAP